VLGEIKSYLENRGFKCEELEGKILKCHREDGFGFNIKTNEKPKYLLIEPGEFSDSIKDLARDLEKNELEDLASEYQGLLADLKVYAFRSSFKVKDEVLPFIEELIEEKE